MYIEANWRMCAFYIIVDIATPSGVLYRQQLCKSQFAICLPHL